jgi:hypothetical protein
MTQDEEADEEADEESQLDDSHLTSTYQNPNRSHIGQDSTLSN